MALFDSNFLRRLEYLSLVSRRVFRGKLLAQRRTKQLGGGIEFSDHREYSHGDDLRYVDWNVYARYGDVLLKRFQEEEDLHVYLLLDVSKSMANNSTEKFDYARRVTAALAYIALADMDRVSIYAYSEKVDEVLPLTRGKDRILSVLRYLEGLTPTGDSTQLKQVARAVAQRARRNGLAVIISDFYDQNGFREGVDLLRYRRFEPHLIQLHTPEEASPKILGDVELRDVESGRLRKHTITEHKLRQYQKAFGAFLQSIDDYCRAYSLGCTRTSTDLPFDELMLRMMRAAGVTT